jgi:hypothetical protein
MGGSVVSAYDESRDDISILGFDGCDGADGFGDFLCSEFEFDSLAVFGAEELNGLSRVLAHERLFQPIHFALFTVHQNHVRGLQQFNELTRL